MEFGLKSWSQPAPAEILNERLAEGLPDYYYINVTKNHFKSKGHPLNIQ